jgi:hypothetical protein
MLRLWLFPPGEILLCMSTHETPLYLVLLAVILSLVFILKDRYQIVTGPIGNLKIDTLTGQVWRDHGEHFSPVPTH